AALRDRHLSRRAFIQLMTATGMSVSAAMALADQALAQAAPRRGGHFKMGSEGSSTSDTMDPAMGLTTIHYLNNFASYNNLVELDSDKKPVPELAESWESKSVREWIFNLRKGVEFHNGKTFTADDVIYTLQRIMGPESKSAAKSYLTDVK